MHPGGFDAIQFIFWKQLGLYDFIEVLVLLLSPFHFIENQHCEIADGQSHLALLNYSFNLLNLIHI